MRGYRIRSLIGASRISPYDEPPWTYSSHRATLNEKTPQPEPGEGIAGSCSGGGGRLEKVGRTAHAADASGSAVRWCRTQSG
jgi:hypothetical protein